MYVLKEYGGANTSFSERLNQCILVLSILGYEGNVACRQDFRFVGKGEKKMGKRTIILLVAVICIVLVGTVFAFIVPQMEPYLSTPPNESIAMNIRVNQTDTYHFESSVRALFGALAQVEVNYFSEDLRIFTQNNETIPRVFPYSRKIDVGMDGKISWDLRIAAPSTPGNYTIHLRFTVFHWMFSRSYSQSITVNAVLPKPPALEGPLIIVLEKSIYNQGEYMTVTIKNVANETILFTNTAYDLRFEVFNGTGWGFYKEVTGNPVTTSMQPNETAQVLCKLDERVGSPFPAGHYRVGTKGISAEFRVVRPMT